MPKDPKEKEKEKEEKERKAREKLEEKERKEREKIAAKEAKEREKQQQKDLKEREKAEKKAAASGGGSAIAMSVGGSGVGGAGAGAAGTQNAPGTPPSPSSSTASFGAMGSTPDRNGSAGKTGAFSRRSVHGKKEPEKSSSLKVMIPLTSAPPPLLTPSAPPNTMEYLQKAFLGAPLVRKEHPGSSRFRPNQAPPLEKLPSLVGCKNADRNDLLIKKLRQCANVYNFDDATMDVKSKDIKRQALEEIHLLLRSERERNFLTEQVHEELFAMFSANAFRVLSPPSVINGADYDPEEDDPVLEPAWPHLQGVYDVFCAFLEHPDFSQAFGRKFIDTQFALYLLELFDSEDPRERDMLKSILHRVYGKIVPLRGHIRRCINDIFQRFVYEPPGKFNGIAELLEILGSIINGFALPLKEEHKTFLFKALMPLHKAKSLTLYHSQLLYCVVQFVEKDRNLASPIIDSLLHMWPRTHSPKEVMYLAELEDIISVLEPEDFARMHETVFNRLARSLSSQHFQVAERALCYFNSDVVLAHVRAFVTYAMPVLFGALSVKARVHWNRNINALLVYALKKLLEIDEVLFNQCAVTHKAETLQLTAKSAEREQRWDKLEAMAMKNPLSRTVVIAHPVAPPPPNRTLAEDQSDGSVVAELQRLSVDMDPRSLKNAKMRRKSFLPQDAEVQQAIMAHTPHGLNQSNGRAHDL